jgi:hypothetical protein
MLCETLKIDPTVLDKHVTRVCQDVLAKVWDTGYGADPFGISAQGGLEQAAIITT